MILLIDTTKEKLGRRVAEEIAEKGIVDFDLVEAGEMNISHCTGCNFCWLKTPGRCPINDDYEPILKKMKDAEQIWLVSDTSFGFISYKTKNLVDRVMPLVTMNLHMKNGEMRHVMRYKNNADFGIIYTGAGNQSYLERWNERMTLNFSSHSLGVFSADRIKEAVSCM